MFVRFDVATLWQASGVRARCQRAEGTEVVFWVLLTHNVLELERIPSDILEKTGLGKLRFDSEWHDVIILEGTCALQRPLTTELFYDGGVREFGNIWTVKKSSSCAANLYGGERTESASKWRCGGNDTIQRNVSGPSPTTSAADDAPPHMAGFRGGYPQRSILRPKSSGIAKREKCRLHQVTMAREGTDLRSVGQGA